jgi:cytoplasmic iron level regulating protein YaaA (DUF328/UPF0246 family)
VTERLYVLLPPSLGKSLGGRRTSGGGTFAEELGAPRAAVVAALAGVVHRAEPRELESTFSAKGDLLERAIVSAIELERGSAQLAPAWRRYQGVVWAHVAPESLSSPVRRRILVTSGLYGLLAGEDPIADYRLKMNAPLAPFASLARWWRPFITDALDRKTRGATIVNLLTNEHTASVDLVRLGAQREIITVRFVTSDERNAVGHDAKAVKGVLARQVLLEGTGALGSLSWQGWNSRREGSDVIVTAPPVRMAGPRISQ